MKIAIPVFHTKISPRFDQTQGFVVLETKSTDVVARENIATEGLSDLEKMKHLLDLGVDTLICGGIDRFSLQYLCANGVKIYSWVTGEVEDAVTCFLDKKMKSGIILGQQGKMKGRWQFCKGKNHLCNMYQKGFYKGEKGVKAMPEGDGTGPDRPGPRAGMNRGGRRAGKGCRSNGNGRAQRSGRGVSVKGQRKRERE